jgi:replicative DNA helicase
MDERKEWSLAENVVAGEILTSPVDVIPRIRKIVNASDFQNNGTRAIYYIAVILISNGKPCDYLQMQSEAKEMGIELTDD